MISIRKDYFNHIEWRNKLNQFHRVDGPAIEYPDGHKEWLIRGQRHREDGPAIINADGHKEWWINGKCILLHVYDILFGTIDSTLIHKQIR
jgi:hypothetical protein